MSYEFDPRNARKRDKKAREALRKSLEAFGAGRSVVVDKNDVLISGNGVYEQAKELGIPVREIETEGDELIVVKRRDLETADPKRIGLALADNKLSDRSEFDWPVVADHLSEPERNGDTMVDKGLCPALLVSYVYLKPFLKNRSRYHFRDWVMDSGAFSVWKSGGSIDLQEYTDTCAKLLEEDDKLTEVFALDVVGDWEGTARNTEEMWKQGVPAIPAFHYGEPEEALIEMAQIYPKIALGGIVGLRAKEKKRWIGQCFARVWPKKIHGFGVGSEDMILSFPFHSVDATNWEMGPCAFGIWQTFGGLSLRGSQQDLRSEVARYLAIERKARGLWGKEMQKLDGGGCSVRLAEVSSGRMPPWEKTKADSSL